ncbi:THO complex subunit 4A-like isoform X1 [Micractinium conductrix]|uniref:THO complex subunit 4A-like isoform X1 n=1 Tax=Micractinium conductrix TaxID=554055 RepID=A0A2P6VN37_9CHLO|nr:THO complex subunit 4A-like isoform X1 [Micractinium conductrix]|eukprot:PSC75467.1 THO complex subunit 4A-like isoform X1 [Micractinium conductrix]
MAAEAALNKSLDDLIAEQRTKKDTRTQKKDTRRGQKPGGEPRRASGGAPRREPTRNLSITVKNQGGIAKARGPRAAPLIVREEDPERRERALEGDGKWGHDLYTGPPRGAGGAGGRGRAPRGPKDPSALGTKLFISNLHYNVTEADIKELFETVGTVVSHAIHYDNSGRSEETAEVIFRDAGDAERALRRYNGVQLDGNSMQIELIPQAAGGGGAGGGPGGARTLSSGVRISGERGGPRVVQVTRHFQLAAGGGSRNVRGRGSVRGGPRGGPSAMQE